MRDTQWKHAVMSAVHATCSCYAMETRRDSAMAHKASLHLAEAVGGQQENKDMLSGMYQEENKTV